MTLARSKLLTFEQYVTYDDGTDCRYELMAGRLIAMVPPTGRHSIIVERIHDLLKTEIQRLALPWVARREIGVRVGLESSRTPDLCAMTLEQEQSVRDVPAVLQTPPLLVVEVVSPSTTKTDYRAKRSEYAVCGIPEYWIVDADAAKVTVLTLVEGFYDLSEFRDDERILSATFTALVVTARDVLR
ncbi:Uma2 family endonuclease [Gloeobacter kilaueensis]|uniref:Putative restriction endonuclease domain-containing protein n=1 Tax=Gloeobacter kilaueensis (strain ATCC BAA-2537 / CCAP 1431/1 / ULC 316 / JS1) TaxID=1183438 RepID=U5QNK9_GLOK1|nr:Uma2 family endonuclease [Gloeobacter kilaueensis]AGY59184.1 hypothetical protein GKIL_2938 [Gloeobacter kilaueensis JS1]